jgi:hypothetical protein
MREQLWAFLDGELTGTTRQAMQVHLETCASCKEELAALRRLSQTLREAPLPAALPPAARFSEALVQRLPPRSTHAIAVSMPRAGWLVPLGMLLALVLVQATSVLSILVGLARSAGLLGEMGSWLSDGSGQTLWFGAVQLILQNILGFKALFGLQVANDTLVGLQQWFIIPLLWQSAMALTYLAGLKVWLSGRQSSRASNPVLE